jgi:hypothetical protein
MVAFQWWLKDTAKPLQASRYALGAQPELFRRAFARSFKVALPGQSPTVFIRFRLWVCHDGRYLDPPLVSAVAVADVGVLGGGG